MDQSGEKGAKPRGNMSVQGSQQSEGIRTGGRDDWKNKAAGQNTKQTAVFKAAANYDVSWRVDFNQICQCVILKELSAVIFLEHWTIYFTPIY